MIFSPYSVIMEAAGVRLPARLALGCVSGALARAGQGWTAPYERREDMDEMTSAELNQYLENIARLIEANIKDAKAASNSM